LTTETKTRGFYGWWLLFFLWIVYTIPIGFAFYSPAVIYPFMISGLGWSRGEIMIGATALVLCFGMSAPLNAWMIGRFGARNTLAIGGVIVVISSALMGLLGHNYSTYLVLSLFVGLGAAFASMIPCQMVIISWFSARRAMAMGLVLGGGAIGGFLAPQLISAVIQNSNGNWRIGWFIIALASIAGIITALITVRNHPADVGQYPDGRAPGTDETTTMRKTSRTYRTEVEWTLRDAVRSRSLWFLIVAVSCGLLMWQVIVSQGPLHLQDRGFDPGMAAFFYSLAIGLSIVGRFTIAALGDIVEPRFLFACGIACILVGGVLFWFVSPAVMWTAYFYPLIAGFGFGLTYICLPTIIGNYWGIDAFARIRGIEAPIELSISGITAPLAGFLYDLQGTYFTIMVISWIAGVIGLVAILLCTPPRQKVISVTEEAV
jgi:Na+/melibiose symporter-like transporter